jgi:FAS-associated factor 2
MSPTAAQKLEVTTYPSVAFIALQPQRGSLQSSSATGSMTVLSRHQGPSSGPTSASTLVAHLETQLLPRVQPFLDRVRATIQEREHERALRRMQEEAFEAAARKDKQRIEQRMEEDRRQQREQQEREQRENEERVRKTREESEKAQWEERRGAWRRWARSALVPPESKKGGIRVTVRMPDGSRRIRILSPSDSLTGLYAFVDSQFVPPTLLPADDPVEVPGGFEAGEAGISSQIERLGSADEWWGFGLVFAYPRKELAWAPGARLGDMPQMSGGAQLVVEKRPAEAISEGSDSDS